MGYLERRRTASKKKKAAAAGVAKKSRIAADAKAYEKARKQKRKEADYEIARRKKRKAADTYVAGATKGIREGKKRGWVGKG